MIDFRLVAQCLNQLRYRVPPFYASMWIYSLQSCPSCMELSPPQSSLQITRSYHQCKWITSLISIFTWSMTYVVTCTLPSTQNGC